MPRCAAVFVCLCAALLSPQAADAQYFGRNKVHYEQLDFTVLGTEHFDIYYYREEAAAAEHAARMAERWYARLSRLLDHTFNGRQPLILYASHPHFSQTNVTSGAPGDGVGGLTERLKSRIAMPFAAGLGETDHVLGHEIAHAFQIDIARRAKGNAFALPGWFIEGMAEYLSLGPVNAHTSMWLRDALLHERLPTLDQLNDHRYFPYRYGHALWAFLATRFGDDVIGVVLRSRGNVVQRLEHVTGLDRDALTREWHASVAAALPQEAPAPGLATGNTVVGGGEQRRARLNLAPALSPDGTRLTFLSERDRLSIDLFEADATTGQVRRKVVSTAADPHFDSLQYIHSAGAWDPEGRRFAFTAVRRGHPVLAIVDVDEPEDRQEYVLPTLGEIYNPSWSPDGSRVVISALAGGLSDLFVFTPATGDLTRLTNDEYADLQPAWSPDGKTIAFATDRFTSTLDLLEFGGLRIALLDVETKAIRPLLDGMRSRSGKQINPHWSPRGRAVYFISDRDGASNVYRAAVETGELRQVTSVRGGVSGVTATSPALAVASRAGTLAFSVYRNGRFEIRTLDEATAMRGRPIEPPSGYTVVPSRVASTNGELSQMLVDPSTGLADAETFTTTPYDDRLRLEALSPPYIGAATGNTFGGALRASFGMSFGDTLRDRQLQTLVRVGTDADDFAAQLAYVNRKRQWNWGVTAGFVPSRFVGAHRAIDREGTVVTREMSHLRYTHQWAGLAARYALNRSQRIELGLGVRRTGFEWQTVTRVTDVRDRKVLSREREEAPAGDPIHLAEAKAAYVHDTAVFGPVGPVLGQRLRLEVEPAFGGIRYADVRVDYRRYFMPVRPVTIAARVEHVGRYGKGGSDPRLTPMVLGLQTLVRGYDLRRFAADECGRTATACSVMNELAGSRLALLNLELRAPLFGLFTGDLDYGKLPIEAIAYLDAGFLWTRQPGSGAEQDRFRSVGVGARVNVGGIVFELTAARPFDGSRQGWKANLLLRPGF